MTMPLYRCNPDLPPRIPRILSALDPKEPLKITEGIVGDDLTSFRIEVSRGRGCIEIYGGRDGRFTTLVIVQAPRNVLGWRASRLLHQESVAALVANGMSEMTDDELGELPD
jgi:hypothetical protein